MDKDGKTPVIGTFSLVFPMKSSRLIPSFTITRNLSNYWCSALGYFTCKQVPSLKIAHLS